MKITTLAVGKKHDTVLAAAIAEYEKRLKSYCDFAWRLIPGSDKDTESAAILKAVKPDDTVILLDETGRSLSSPQLAGYLELAQNNSVKHLVIIIGGPFGVNDDVLKRSVVVVSLSRMVFPHQIVRLLLVEQLYRAYSILAGSGYHHS